MSLEGQVLDGKYAIVRRIAEGGMSTIYLGVNERIGKDVAVKVLHPVVARDPEILARFEREARIVSRIRSDHVADVFDFGELPTGERFMVMEYLEGESLASILERDRTIPPRTLVTIASQILDGLAAAHRAGVIHRDLKPENVIVATRGREVVVKVVDFGISKLLDSANETRVKATAAGSVLGTPLYMSPEQARGHTSLIDQRTDIYSLGVMLYEATAGEPPLMGENVNDLLFRVALDEPEPLTAKVPSVDPALAAIVRKAMAKDPSERYQTADEMREDVDAWLGRYVTSTIPPTSFEGVAATIRSSDGGEADRSSAQTVATPMTVTVSDDAKDELGPPARKRSRALRRIVFAAPLVALLVIFVGSPDARRQASALVSSTSTSTWPWPWAPASTSEPVMPPVELAPAVPPGPTPAEVHSLPDVPAAPPGSETDTASPASTSTARPPATPPRATPPRAAPRRATPSASLSHHDPFAVDAGTTLVSVAQHVPVQHEEAVDPLVPNASPATPAEPETPAEPVVPAPGE